VFKHPLAEGDQFELHPSHPQISERFAISIERAKTADEIFGLRPAWDTTRPLPIRPATDFGPTVSRCVEYINSCTRPITSIRYPWCPLTIVPLPPLQE
jgi:hypothetical protein